MTGASRATSSPRSSNSVPVIQEELGAEGLVLDTFEEDSNTCYDLGGSTSLAAGSDTANITRGNAFAHVESVEIIPKRNKERKVLLNPMTVLFPESKYNVDLPSHRRVLVGH